MYAISGCPRSGTSLMMDLMRTAYGEDRLMGEKFPREDHPEKMREKGSEETDAQYQVRMYLLDKSDRVGKAKKELERAKDMNPNGFWEMKYTVAGVRYRFHDIEDLEKIRNEEKKSFCKIVSQGLVQSDPQYIDKVIYMIRHPRAVAKSQEKLGRQFPLNEETEMKRNGKDVKIHTPEMFINVTAMVSTWLLAYPEIPILFVMYDDLLQDPDSTIDKIEDFLGEKILNKKEVVAKIDKRLKRSFPEDIDHDLWEDADFVYDQFVQKNYQGIIDHLKNPKIKRNQKNVRIPCQRNGSSVSLDVCKECRSKKTGYIRNQKKVSDRKGIDWEAEPCIFECGFNTGFKPLTIEESIQHNFWKDGVDPISIPLIDKEKALTNVKVHIKPGN